MALIESAISTSSMSGVISNPQDTEISSSWRTEFHNLFESAVARYQSGLRGGEKIFSEKDAEFLASIGANTSEMYDYVEDWNELSEPSFETILAIASVRRDYFVKEQERKSSGRTQSPETFPPGTLSMGGFRWLPRIIAKARAKLKGELPPDLMYSCGMDRPFLRKVGIAPEDFLKTVWEAGPHDSAILARVQESASKGQELKF